MDHKQKKGGRDNDAADQAPDQCPRLASDQYLEDLAVYAETMVAHGQEKAKKRFPLLAEHLSRCPSCMASVDDAVAFLNEPDETR